MPLVALSGVSVSFGVRTLFEGVNLTVATGSRIALVGPNGSGKTTLMRILAGISPADSGSVVREKETRVSYVPQSGVVHQGVPLAEEVEKAFSYGASLVEQMRQLEERLGSVSQGAGDAEVLVRRHHELQEKLDASGYWGRAEGISRVLSGLGFRREDMGKPASAFSGGWQMRIALAKAILERPDILLLDEPTNYLDLEARSWLEGFLSDFPGGIMVVSHDRYFLDVTVKQIAEIYMSHVSLFTGNYTKYESVRAAELASIMDRWREQQAEIEKIEAFIRRFRYKATKARQVQSRINYLERLPRIEVPPVGKTLKFSFPPPPPSGRIVLSARDLSKSYNGIKVFDGVGLELEKGQKLAVVGVNGAGKSTLLRIVSGKEKPDAGELAWGTGIASVSYSQESADAWTSERQVIEEVEAQAPTSLVPEVRTMLGAFLFRGDDVFKPVSVLSGGEKSRLALLLLLLKPANLLILDEPTNHLDLASKDMLLEALGSFPATVVFVSHDRHFIEKLATSVMEMKDGGSRWFPGDYDYYLRRVAQEEAEDAAAPQAVRPAARVVAAARAAAPEPAPERSDAARDRLEDKKLKADLRSLEREEAQVLEQLEALDAESRRLEEEMARPEVYSDGARMKELTRSHDSARARHDALMEKWESLNVKISETKTKMEDLRSGRGAR